MSENFGLRIGLEGEREFKKALSDINASLPKQKPQRKRFGTASLPA